MHVKGISLKGVTLTHRVILLLLVGALPLMLVKSHLAGLIIFIVFNTIVSALVLFDLKVTPTPDVIVVSRICNTKLSIGEKNKIVVRVFNRSWKPLNITLRDEYPLEFATDITEFSTTFDGRSETRFIYHVTPSNRGRFIFGNVILRYRGTLELTTRQIAFPVETEIRVYPNIVNISRFELMIKRSHLQETGFTPERRRGMGTEFESLKEYTRDDEFRSIDWKATARKNKLISRQYQSEINQSIIVVVDCSRPMGARVEEFTLLDYSINAALLLGHVVTRKDDKIGLLAFSDRVHFFLPPRRGKRQYHHFLDKLHDLQPRRVEPNYELAFRFIMNRRLKRSLVVLLTDLSAGAAAQKLRESAWLLSRKHLPVVVSITDPLVTETAYSLPKTEEDVYKKLVSLEVLERVKKAKRAVENMGVVPLLLPPKQVCSAVLTNYLSLKLRSRL